MQGLRRHPIHAIGRQDRDPPRAYAAVPGSAKMDLVARQFRPTIALLDIGLPQRGRPGLNFLC
jgi:hypothetical protein